MTTICITETHIAFDIALSVLLFGGSVEQAMRAAASIDLYTSFENTILEI